MPLVVVFLPNRAQAAMISSGKWPAGCDPYKLDNRLRSIMTGHGATYIDILPDLRSVPNFERMYFPGDGHLNAEGHPIIAGMLAKELTNGSVPELKSKANRQVAFVPVRK